MMGPLVSCRTGGKKKGRHAGSRGMRGRGAGHDMPASPERTRAPHWEHVKMDRQLGVQSKHEENEPLFYSGKRMAAP